MSSGNLDSESLQVRPRGFQINRFCRQQPATHVRSDHYGTHLPRNIHRQIKYFIWGFRGGQCKARTLRDYSKPKLTRATLFCPRGRRSRLEPKQRNKLHSQNTRKRKLHRLPHSYDGDGATGIYSEGSGSLPFTVAPIPAAKTVAQGAQVSQHTTQPPPKWDAAGVKSTTFTAQP